MAYASQVRRKLLDQVASGKDPARVQRVTVGDAVDAYLIWAEKVGKHTKPDRNRWNVHLSPSLQNCLITSVTSDLLMDLQKVLAATLGPQSIRHCFGFLRRAVNHAIKVDKLEINNPFMVRRGDSFQLPRADNASVCFLTPDEATNLSQALKTRSKQLHDMALLSFRSGMRAAEIFTIKRQGIDLSGGYIHFVAKGGAKEHVNAPQDSCKCSCSMIDGPATSSSRQPW